MSARFYIYYALKQGKKGSIKSPSTADNVSYSGYMHNPDKKRMSFLSNSQADKGSFVRDFQVVNPDFQIISTSSSTASATKQNPQTTVAKKETPAASTGEGRIAKKQEPKEESGNGVYYLVGLVGAGVIGFAIYSSFKGKKKKRKR